MYIFSNQVTLGEHNRLEEGEGNLSELVLTVKKLVIHPRYDESKTLNDVALLHLTEEVDLATYTPACLPPHGVTTAYDGKMALALGNLTTLCPPLSLYWSRSRRQYAITNQQRAGKVPYKRHFFSKPRVRGFGRLQLDLYGIRVLAAAIL